MAENIKYFIGIRPIKDISSKVAGFQRRYKYITTAEPHITLWVAYGVKTERPWMENLKNFISRHRAFVVKLGTTGRFGNDVLFLKVFSRGIRPFYKGISEVMMGGVKRSAARGALKRFVPHLTLAVKSRGIGQKELRSMEMIAKKKFAQPAVFRVEYVRVYKKSARKNKYVKLADIELKK